VCKGGIVRSITLVFILINNSTLLNNHFGVVLQQLGRTIANWKLTSGSGEKISCFLKIKDAKVQNLKEIGRAKYLLISF